MNDLFLDIIHIENVLINPNIVINALKNITWDESIKSRKTISFGKPYNYSGISYDETLLPKFLSEMIGVVKSKNKFIPNNCLINYYFDGKSKMGFHSDDISILDDNSGVGIFSFGSTRTIRFKNKNDNSKIIDIELTNNSYFYMGQETQKEWLHSILPDTNIDSERYSITLRKLVI